MNSLLHSSNLKPYKLLSFHMKWCTWHRDSSFLLVQGHSRCHCYQQRLIQKGVDIWLRLILILLLNFQVLLASVSKFRSLCHFLSNLVDMCCFQQNTCARKKNLISHNWGSGTVNTLWFVTYPDTVIKVMSLYITVYLVCESSLNVLPLDFMFIPYITFNFALSRVVALPECPCRLLTSAEAQMISYNCICCATLCCQNEMPSGNCRRLECKWDLHKEAH